MLKSLFLRVFRPDRMPVIAAGDDPVRFEALSRAYWDDRTQKINEIIQNGDSLSPQDQQDRLHRTIESLKAEYRANKTRTDIDDTTRQQAENELVKLQLSVVRSAKMLNTTHPVLDRVRVEQMADVYWGNRRRELKHSVLGANLAPQDKQELLRRTLHSLRNEQMSHNANPQLDPLVRSRTDSELTDLMILTTQEIRKTMQSIDATVAPAPVVKERYWTAERVADYLEPIARAAREARRLAEEKIDDFKIWLPPVMEKISRRAEDTRSHATHMAQKVATTIGQQSLYGWNTIRHSIQTGLSTVGTVAQKARDNKPSWVTPQNAVALGGVGASLASVFALVSVLKGQEPAPAPEVAAAPVPMVPASSVAIAKADTQQKPLTTDVAASAPSAKPVAILETKYEQSLPPDANFKVFKACRKNGPCTLINFNRNIPEYLTGTSNQAIERWFRHGIVMAESAWDHWKRDNDGNIVTYNDIPQPKLSSAGAIGLSQLMPDTARAIITLNNLPYTMEQVRRDPAANYAVGLTYFKMLVERYNDFRLATLAYNMGETNMDKQFASIGNPMTGKISVASFTSRLPHYLSESRNYLPAVLQRIENVASNLIGNLEDAIEGHVPSYRPPVTSARRSTRSHTPIQSVSYQYNDNARGSVRYDVNATMLRAGPPLSSGTELKAGPSYGQALSSGTEDRILEADGSNVLQSVSPN